MKLAIAQIEIIPARPDLNFQKIKDYVEKAKQQKVDIVIFPELSIPGYLISDMWEEQTFLKDCLYYNDKVIELATDIRIVFGTIDVDFNNKYTDGRSEITNVLYYAYQNSLYRYIKTLLPNYREFEEPRHFRSAIEKFNLTQEFEQELHYKPNHLFSYPPDELNIGFVLCEDFWDKDYNIKPIKEFVDNGANLIINCSCSPFTSGKNRSRNRVALEHVKTHNIPLIYCNCCGLQNNGKTVYTFDGSSVVYNNFGNIIAHAEMFKEDMLMVEWKNNDLVCTDKTRFPVMINPNTIVNKDIEEIYQSLTYGIKKYLEQIGTKKVVIGLSGGIDSGVAAALYAQVIGRKNLLLVNMPSKYNSGTTINIARTIAKNIGCYYTEIPIEESVELTKKQIDGLVIASNEPTESGFLKLSPFDYENVQSRDRSSRILAAISSAWSGVYTCNGNKSELTVGYTSFSGDLCGYLAALGDMWKWQIYALAEYINTFYPVLPKEVFEVTPSAELSSDQNVDEGNGDPIVYWYHDQLFASWVEDWFRKTPEDNLRSYINGTINEDLKTTDNVYKLFPTAKEFIEDLEYWYKQFKGMGIYKRIQSPPILALSRRCFGFDLRESSGCYYLTKAYLDMKQQILKGETK